MKGNGKVRDILFQSSHFSYIFKTIYLTCTDIILIEAYRSGILDCPMHLLPISFDRAGPQDIIFLGPPNWNGVLGAPPILMPKLTYGASFLLFIIQS